MRNIFQRKNGQEQTHSIGLQPLTNEKQPLFDVELATKHCVTRFDKIEALLDAVIDAVGVSKVLNNSAVVDFNKRHKEYEEELKKK